MSLVRAKNLINNSQNIVFLTGAGMSTASGIPDFRGPNGVWTTDPDSEKRSTIDSFRVDPNTRKEWWARSQAYRNVNPNMGHGAIWKMERTHNVTVLTQNIDGLHERAGSSNVIELHGSLSRSVCLKCGADVDVSDEMIDRFVCDSREFWCPFDNGIVKPDVVLFGEGLDGNKFFKAEQALRKADVLICAGSTLQVFPVANLPGFARNHNVPVIVINNEPTLFDGRASFVFHEDLGATLMQLCL